METKRSLQPRVGTAACWMVAVVMAGGITVLLWFMLSNYAPVLWQRVVWLWQHPRQLVPISQPFILFPTFLLFLVVWLITKISPQPRGWSRAIVVGILIVLAARYVWWRTFSTLNWQNFLQGFFSLSLYALEMLTIGSGALQLLLLLLERDRREEADRYSEAVLGGKFVPTVDVLVPTYNEETYILKRTIIGCQALEYPSDRLNIYLLDDTRRPAVQALAAALGCHYITRPDNHHAKAGNLNNAIRQTQGELIVCFDADFVPTTNFLLRTVGFFQDERVALVQTPQSFYTPDPIARNLGLENILAPEQESFYRQIQPVRDGTDSVVCAGTSFVLRRSALEEIGGEFVTSSLSEDYFTGVKLSSKGYRLVYLNEKLSAGEAPPDMAAQATQRLRWARGTLQAFFIQENPLLIPGLNWLQRLSHLTGILHWMTSLSRVGFLTIPIFSAFWGVLPVIATQEEILLYFLPNYLVNLTVFSWLSQRSRSLIISEIYDVVLCFPLALTVIQTFWRPFSKGFKVTPKGGQREGVIFHWRLSLPLMIVFGATAVSFWRNLGNCLMGMGEYYPKGLGLPWVWSLYNLFLVGIALLVMLDVPKPDRYEWFTLKRTVKLELPTGQTLWGQTSVISEAGLIFNPTQMPPSPTKPLSN
ncbi:MAG: glycosyltransferase [Pseudanabaenaceae cyanobacterium]